ncbi:MAG: Asp-tRNA(Asn)/Glu-tRNA(Gln) amidotransferase subunit GatB [Anaerolineae bacterium]|nr:Asp-tRNA(Asn)/Glu-tRNA(Gln) amidotransferase subunit GatB [Anaerolineae bacterium]
MDYRATIGMEVHAELDTASKMFCSCSAEFFGQAPNTHICPVCMGYPGTLPVINRQAIEYAIKVGLALNCEIAPFSKFDRKNYTYPDLPKGYQISQYDMPLCIGGWIDVDVDGERKHIRITRAHMEEDTAKTFHVSEASLVDYNRSGVPLLEIVTEPDIHSAEEARQYLIKLRTILRYLGVSTADMEKGAMRCEANVSVSPAGSDKLGTKTEVKNLNSFRSVKQAIDYEIARQIAVLEAGGRVEQVTMGWNERQGRTILQRSKEFAEDYRYFPEPDLPPLELSRPYVDAIRASLPELPDAKQARFVENYGIKTQDAAVLVGDAETADYYEAAVRAARPNQIDPQTVSNWITVEFFRLLNERNLSIAKSPVSPDGLVELLAQVHKNVINATMGKDVLTQMFESGESAPAIIKARGLAQISDASEIEQLVRRAIEDNTDAVEQYLNGKESVIGFLIGQVMRASRGKANPQVVRELMQRQLDARRGK